MISLTFEVTGKPVSYSRSGARFGVLPEKNRVWRDQVRWCYRQATIGRPFYPQAGEHKGCVEVAIRFHGANPRSDLDNLAKEVCDALNEVAWEDDHLIKRLVLEREEPIAGARCAVVTIVWLPVQESAPKKRRAKNPMEAA